MPFDSLTFRHSWRPYQDRVLAAIDAHLNDKRLHIVAAPGAGKTTLGLEVFKRLRKSALVLSPTRVIRDQWIDRLCDFTESDEIASLPWVSKNIYAPKVLTSITYQALHSQLSGELAKELDEAEALALDEGVTASDLDVFISTLKASAIGVIILDEAHHLRAEWWRALDKVCTELPDLVLISLTATPPYDAQANEWSRYEQLCGPIDEEISIPELVKAGTLCAHQDYIWAVDVSLSEQEKVREYDQRVTTLCDTLYQQKEFADIVHAHPWLSADGLETEVIKNPELAIALLAFIKQKQQPLPLDLLITLDLTDQDIPELGRHWWQVLVDAALFSNTFKLSYRHQESIKQLKKQLRATELLHQRELSLQRSRKLGRSLSQSAAKVEACSALHQLEYKQRGNDLRQVVLVDYIRDEELISGLDTGELNLGAWPIFRALTTDSDIPEKIGLLTGRLSIVHCSLVDKLVSLDQNHRFKTEPMASNHQYLKISAPLNLLTNAFTALLMSGELKTLVGTRALLGEGWDAPAINSLILASSVGSFMLTNQMRGRAIRIDKAKPDKVSSIWHLLALDSKSDYSGWSDFYELKKRFNTFVGLSERHQTIESGFDRMQAVAFNRLGIITGLSPVSASNREMASRFRRINGVGKRWQEALSLDASARVIPSVKTPAIPSIRRYHLKNTLQHLLIEIGGAISVTTGMIYQSHPKLNATLVVSVALAIVGVMLYKLPKTIAAVRILLKHLPLEGSIKQIGLALREALCEAGLIETSFRRLQVNVNNNVDGTFYLALSGSTFYESSLFADCLAEILAPIENPRYLIVRAGVAFGMQRDDYHAVPIKLGIKKDFAQIFYKAWCKHLGPTELIYTRTDLGRKKLLKARMKAFSSTFSREVKRQDRWQAKP